MIKKILKIIALLAGILLVVIIGLAIWKWDTIKVMLDSREVHGPISGIPGTEPSLLPPITRGATDWICWRGPDGNSRSTMTGISTDWSKGLKKKWEVDFLCQGKTTAAWSAPVIQGNRLVICGRDDKNDLIFCLNPETGSLLWKGSYPAKNETGYGSGPRATPWIDNDRVYTFGRNGDLVCWALKDGSIIWHKNVNDEGGKAPQWGHCSSPLVIDSLVVVNAGGTARTIAYDKETGDLKWKTGNGSAGYAAVREMQIDDQRVILAFHGKGLAALEPKDGKLLWDTPWKTSHKVNATTPVVSDNLIFITSGYGTGGETLKVSKSEAKVVWQNKAIASQHSDPFIIDGFIYGYSGQSSQNRGTFKCLDLQTGEEKWASKEIGWGTCVYVEGYLLCCDIKGNLFLVKPDPEKFIKITEYPQALGKIKGGLWTVPVLANGHLFLRLKQRLLCFEINSPTSGEAEKQ